MSKYVLSGFADEAAADLKGQIAALKRNKMGFIEIRFVDGKSISAMDAPQAKEVAAALKGSGIGVSAVGSPIGKTKITDDFGKSLDMFKRTLETASILDTKRIRIFSFFMPAGEDPAVYKDEVFARIDRFLELAEGAGIKCCHENEREIYGDIWPRCYELLTTFKGRLHGIFDPANYIFCDERRPSEYFGRLAEYTDYFHIKDVIAETKTMVPAGKGDGGVEDILAAFYDRAGDTFLSVEPHLRVFTGSENLNDAIIGRQTAYASKDEAFDAAAGHLKEILDRRGFQYE